MDHLLSMEKEFKLREDLSCTINLNFNLVRMVTLSFGASV